ncbi:MAG TPA: SsrA-binding protein SmpB [Candidatus Saccharimonadales bacterium]|nr:SsrA-binding protein SmpB [Candidatus Saccharimonadales bacterium]
MVKNQKEKSKITNRRARYDYELADSLVVGLQLTGAEVKALRLGHGTLRGAYVTVKDNELWLINTQITSARGIQISDNDQTRSRKLLAKRREIDSLIKAKQEGVTIVPLELLTGGRFIKLRIAIGKGRKRFDKRETIRKRQQEREIARAKKTVQ